MYFKALALGPKKMDADPQPCFTYEVNLILKTAFHMLLDIIRKTDGCDK